MQIPYNLDVEYSQINSESKSIGRIRVELASE